jgi:hypothetical protein
VPDGAGHIKGFGGAGKRAKPWNPVGELAEFDPSRGDLREFPLFSRVYACATTPLALRFEAMLAPSSQWPAVKSACCKYSRRTKRAATNRASSMNEKQNQGEKYVEETRRSACRNDHVHRHVRWISPGADQRNVVFHPRAFSDLR